MTTEYYDHTNFPANGALGSSSAMRTELEAIETGFSKLPALSGNGGKIVAVNSGASALEAVTTTGTGSAVRATSPTFVTPTLGVATATSINKITLTAPATSCTFALLDGKTFTVNNTLTFSGTDGSTLNIGTGGTLGSAAFTASGDYATAAHNHDGSYSNASFKTISVSGQSDVVADAVDDSLTLVAGTGVTITTNAGSDSVTIAATGFSAANQTEMEAAASNAVFSTPANTNWHPGVAKAWIKAAGNGTAISASHNITSITDGGTGSITVTIATDFSSANYAIVATLNEDAVGQAAIFLVSNQTAGSFSFVSLKADGSTNVDPEYYNAVCYGDQA